ncbi:MAG: GNAT family N-acetyltransferase [Nanoarchaeota archaeon]
MENIEKAKKVDLEEYTDLKVEYLKENYILIRKKIMLSEFDLRDKIKKEFLNQISNKDYFMFLKINNYIVAFIIASKIKNVFKKFGYINDIFVKKEFRGRGFGQRLFKRFISDMEKESIKEFRLGVDIRNKYAIEMYKKLGFKITNYEMEMIK